MKKVSLGDYQLYSTYFESFVYLQWSTNSSLSQIHIPRPDGTFQAKLNQTDVFRTWNLKMSPLGGCPRNPRGYIAAVSPWCSTIPHLFSCPWIKYINQGWLHTRQSNNSALAAEVHQATHHPPRVPGRLDPLICVQLDPFIIYTWMIMASCVHSCTICIQTACSRMCVKVDRWKQTLLQCLHANLRFFFYLCGLITGQSWKEIDTMLWKE